MAALSAAGAALGLTTGAVIVATTAAAVARAATTTSDAVATAARARIRLLAAADLVRESGCDGRTGLPAPLHLQRRLSAAAQRLAQGAGLNEATAAAGYHATATASIHIWGDLSAVGVERMLSAKFCAPLTNPALRDIGLYQRGEDLWIIAAAPFATPELADPARVARNVLQLVNEARSRGRICGTEAFGPARPLRPSPRLRKAALGHSRDMAAHDYFSHTGRDGSTPAQRVSRTGYAWRVIGENIAAGPTNAGEVVQGWLKSPEHCANIMDPRFTETAVAYTVNARSDMGVYWTQEFATPLK